MTDQIKQEPQTPQNQPAKPEPIKLATFESINKVATAVHAEPYDIPGAGRVWIHARSNREIRQWSKDQQAEGGDDDDYIDARLIIMCCGDEQGRRIFGEANIGRIIEWKQHVVGPLVKACLRVNGMSREGEEAIAKNSEKTRTNGS